MTFSPFILVVQVLWARDGFALQQWVRDVETAASAAAQADPSSKPAFAQEQVLEGGSLAATFQPGRVWLDTDGQRIRAHSGGMLAQGSKTYWYGADNYAEGDWSNTKINVYSSEDLYSWQYDGIAFEMNCETDDYEEEEADAEPCFVDRPRVLYNNVTKKYVMWMQSSPYVAVAIASKAEGPFHFVSRWRPNGEEAGDISTFINPLDQVGYLVYNTRPNSYMKISKMDKRMMNVSDVCSTIFSSRQSPTLFYSAGFAGPRFYLWASRSNGEASVFTAPDTPCAISTKWKDTGNPTKHRTSYGSQNSFILPRNDSGREFFIYVGDRFEPFVEEGKESGRYVWLPFTVKNRGKLTDRINMTWRERWSLSDM